MIQWSGEFQTSNAYLEGTDRARIVSETGGLLGYPLRYRAMAGASTRYADGQLTAYIVWAVRA